MDLDTHGLQPATAKFFLEVATALRQAPQLVHTVNGVIQFTIVNTASFFVDLKTPPGRVVKGNHPNPDVTLTYSNETVFNDLNRGAVAPAKAVLLGKLKISGNSKLLTKLMNEVKAVQTAQESAAKARAATPRTGGGSFSGSIPGGTAGGKKEWMSDKDASHCLGCGAVFSFLKRKHHCRLCGRIYCADCSSGTYRGQRACDACIKQASRLRRMVASGMNPLIDTGVGPGVLPKDFATIGPSPATSVANTPVSKPSTPAVASGPSTDVLASSAPSMLDETRSLPSMDAGGDIVAAPESSEDVAALNARLDALQSTIEALQLELSVAPTFEAQAQTPFFVLRESTLLASIVYPLMLIASYLRWRLLPVALLSFAILGLLFPNSWWYGTFTFLVAVAVAAGLWYVSKQPSLETFRRRMYVYGLAFTIWCDYRILRNQTEALDDQELDVVWSLAHKRNAAQVYHLMSSLQGFWIKLGQYLSTRNDLMPEEYISVLAKLQDRVRARPIDQVKKVIEEEFHRPCGEMFKSIDEKALAAASIAQVHRAVLHDGTVVAIKVQHRGMHDILMNDIINLEKLLSWISMVEPSADFKKALEEWGNEVLKELDFKNEAANLIEIRRHLKEANLPITVPGVVEDLVSGKVLVMRFIDGTKLNDTVLLNRPGFDQKALVKSVCEGIAYQLYITGVFTGDPHPGNIMVAKPDSLVDWTEGADNGASFRHAVGDAQFVPVLIDFGLTKRLNANMRLAFAKMVVAAELLDYGGVLNAYNDMGLVLSRESASEDMEGLLYSFRKAKKGKAAREDFKTMAAKKQERMQKDKEAGNEKRKVHDWPSELVFFLRTVELLQGICAMTGHNLMESMTLMARRALVNHIPSNARAQTAVHPSRGLATTPRATPLETAVRKHLEAMIRAEDLLGVQVCVWQGNSVQLDVAAGKMGSFDHRPVQPNSLFPCFGVSRVATSAVVHSFAESRLVDYKQPIASVWKPFGAAGKDRIPVADLLKCRSGLEGAMPAKLSTFSCFNTEELDELAGQIVGNPADVLESLQSSHSDGMDSGPRHPQELVSYLYYGWGWTAAAFIKALTSKPIYQAVADVAAKSGTVDNFMLGVSHDRPDFNPRVVTIDLGKPNETNDESGEQASQHTGSGSKPSASGPATEPPSPSIDRIERQLSVTVKPSSAPSDTKTEEEENQMSERTMATALAAVEIAGVLVEGGLENLKALTAGGREHFMDPRIVNYHKMVHGCAPSANLYATASGLAVTVGAICDSLRQKEVGKAIPSAVQFACENLGFRPLTFRSSSDRGLSVVAEEDSETVGGDGKTAPTPRATGFCMCALGGTMVFCVPSQLLTVAITVNQLSAQRTGALQLAKFVCRELGLGEPVDL